METKPSTGLTIKQDKVGRIMGSHSWNRWLESGAGKLGLLGRQEAGRLLPTFGWAGDLFRGQAPEPGRACKIIQVLATKEGVPNVWASCGGSDHMGWGSFLSKNHAWPLLVPRESPLLRSGVHWEAVWSCWPPSMPCLHLPTLGTPGGQGRTHPLLRDAHTDPGLRFLTHLLV